MFLSKTSINKPVMTTMFILALVLMGALAYLKLPLNDMPETNIPVVTVQVIYPGAGPEEIESNITKDIEDELSTIGGLDYVESYVMENINTTVARFKMGKDADEANKEVKDKIDAIKGEFPGDSEEPVITKLDVNAKPVLELAFVSQMDTRKAYEYADKKIKEQLARVNGVSTIDISGGQEREVHVVLSKDNLQKYAISPLQVMAFIQQNNYSMPGGNINRNGAEYSVKIDGELNTVDELKGLRINTPKGYRKLSDIAEILDSGEKITKVANFFNLKGKQDVSSAMTLHADEPVQPSLKNRTVINLQVNKQSDANTVVTAQDVKKVIASLNETLPQGSAIEIGTDGSTFIENSVNDTMTSIYLGILFTAIVLYIFLHNFSTTMIAAVSMPVVIVATFLLADTSGFSLNMMSLMALSVSVGTLVTNSVVIIENIMKYIKMGYSREEAADKGTAEIAVAVIASTLTNVVVFVPIASMSSIVGQFFVEFGLMVTFAMLFSIIVSFTLTPMMASKLLKEETGQQDEKKNKGFGVRFDVAFERFTLRYRKLVASLVKTWQRRFAVIIGSLALLVVSFMIVGPSLGMGFIPFVDDGDVSLKIELPTYYELDRTRSIFSEIEQKIVQHNEVDKVITNIGKLGNSQGVNMGSIQVKLQEQDGKRISTHAFAGLLSSELAAVPDARIKVAATSSVSGGPGGDPIQILVQGENLSRLQSLTSEVFEVVKDIPGMVNTDTDMRAGKPEIKIFPKRKKITDYGTSVSDIAMTIRASIEGLKASVFKEKGQEYDIKIKLDKLDIDDIDKIKNITILTQKGNVKVSELADIKFGTAPTMITRKNKMKMYKVTATNVGRTIGEINNDINRLIAEKITIPEGYVIAAGGDVEMMNDAATDFGGAFVLAIVLTFMLIAAILESYKQTVMIMSTIPLALIGVLWALFITGESLNIFSMMAGVMLIGIVVNNAILVLDFANQLRREGKSAADAIIEACPAKLKAVIMATLASGFGMLPLALGIGKGAEMRQGMGVVSIGGLLMSSILTLVVIPALYAQFITTGKKKSKAAVS